MIMPRPRQEAEEVSRLRAEIERLKHTLIEVQDGSDRRQAVLMADNERLRAENIRVSCHCADLIQAMLDHGISEEAIKAITDEQKVTNE